MKKSKKQQNIETYYEEYKQAYNNLMILLEQHQIDKELLMKFEESILNLMKCKPVFKIRIFFERTSRYY